MPSSVATPPFFSRFSLVSLFSLVVLVSHLGVASPALAASAEPAREFDGIVALATERSPPEAVPLMEAWIAANPNDVRAAKGLIWLARLELASGQRDQARGRLRRVVDEYPGTEWELHAHRTLGDMAIKDHRYGEAVTAFENLVHSGQPLFAEPGRLLSSLARAARWRWNSVLGLGGALFAFLAWRVLRLGRSALWPPPQEVVSMLPILSLIAFAAFIRTEGESGTLALLSGGAAVLLWLNGAYLRARPPQGARRFGHALFGLAQGAFLLYGAIVVSGLWDKMRDTMVMGGGE